jgi:hypothetical protein
MGFGCSGYRDGRRSTLSAAFTSAPAAISSCSTAPKPQKAASMSGVRPNCARNSTREIQEDPPPPLRPPSQRANSQVRADPEERASNSQRLVADPSRPGPRASSAQRPRRRSPPHSKGLRAAPAQPTRIAPSAPRPTVCINATASTITSYAARSTRASGVKLVLNASTMTPHARVAQW